MLAVEPLNTPAYVRVRETLRADILAGAFPPGTHVRLSELSRRYGLSANPIREALLHLEGEGIIAMRNHRGAIVAPVDRRFVENVYDLRAAIQAMLARRAAEQHNEADLAAIRAAEAEFARAAAAGNEAAAVVANRRFHAAIDRIAGNAMALEVLEGRSSLAYAVRRRFGYGPGRLAAVAAQHAGIVAAIAARDPDRAAAALAEHCQDAKRDLLALLDSTPDNDGTDNLP